MAGLGQKVDAAKTALQAAAIATRQPVPGVKPPQGTDIVGQQAKIASEFLDLFDRATLKELLAKRTTPLGTDGAGLTLEALNELQPLKPGLKTLLKDLEIVAVAALPLDRFLEEMDKKGIDVVSLREPLAAIHTKAVLVKELLSKLPSSCTLTSDRV